MTDLRPRTNRLDFRIDPDPGLDQFFHFSIIERQATEYLWHFWSGRPLNNKLRLGRFELHECSLVLKFVHFYYWVLKYNFCLVYSTILCCVE